MNLQQQGTDHMNAILKQLEISKNIICKDLGADATTVELLFGHKYDQLDRLNTVLELQSSRIKVLESDAQVSRRKIHNLLGFIKGMAHNATNAVKMWEDKGE